MSHFYRPVAADVAGEVLGCGLAGGQAGDAQRRDRAGDHLGGVAAAVLAAFADLAGDVALDEEHLLDVGEQRPDVFGGVEDLDGAFLAAPVSGLGELVADRDGGPVQGVERGEQLRVLALTVIT